MSTDALDLLATAPERWRYPGLAGALAGGNRPDLPQAATLLLADIARPRALRDSLAAMIQDGQFDNLENLLLELLERQDETVVDADLTQVTAELDRARADAIADASRAWTELNTRAAAVGLPAQDVAEVLELAASSQPDAQRLVMERAEEIVAAEKRRRTDLEQQLQHRLTEIPPGPGNDAWAAAVHQSVHLGEFGIAAKLLAAGPEHKLDEGPLTVPPIPWHWPWRDDPVADVLGWYADRWASPGPEFTRYRPPAGDAAAARLVAALGVAAVRLERDVVAELAGALAQVVGGVSVGEPYPDGPGLAVDITGLNDKRLPSMAPFAEQVTLWTDVGTDPRDGPPPRPQDDRPVVWFRPVMEATPTERVDVAVLDVSTLLRLLAPEPSGQATDALTRRINLLRLLIRQLDPALLLTNGVKLGGELSARDHLAWLLDAFAVMPDAPVLDGLLQNFGTHSGVMRCVVEALVSSARESDHGRRVTAADVTRIGRELGARIGTAILAPLAGNALAQATLWLVLQRFDEDQPCTVEDVLAEFADLGVPTRVSARLVNHDGIAGALQILANEALLPPCGERFGFPAPGIAAALRDLPGPSGTERVQALLDELTLVVQQADDAAAAVLGPRITHLIGHRVDNDVISVLRRLERCTKRVTDVEVRDELDDLRRRIHALGGGTYVRLYYEALTPPAPVEVTELVSTLIGSVEWHLPADVRISQQGDAHCWVHANPTLLEESLRNLVLNAARAMAKLGRQEHLGIEVSVYTVAASATRAVAMSGDAVVIEVTDSGPGFSAEELAQARAVTGTAVELWRPVTALDGGGQGLPLTASLLLDYGGELEIDNGSGRLSGGSVKVWLPRSDGQTPP